MTDVIIWGVKFSTDAILQTFGGLVGAFLGALLAGLYAIRIMKNQLNYDKKHKDEKSLKDVINFRHIAICAMEYLHEVYEAISAEEFTDECIKKIKLNLAIMNKYEEQLYAFNDDAIPFELFHNYKLIVLSIGGLGEKAREYTSFESEDRRMEVAEWFKKFIDIIQSEIDKLEVYKEKTKKNIEKGK